MHFTKLFSLRDADVEGCCQSSASLMVSALMSVAFIIIPHIALLLASCAISVCTGLYSLQSALPFSRNIVGRVGITVIEQMRKLQLWDLVLA